MAEYVNFELNCPLYDDLFSEIELLAFDEPFLEEGDPLDVPKEVKEDVNLGC